MERLVLHDARQIVHVALLTPHAADVVIGPVLALLGDGHLGELERVRFREDAGVEGPGGHRDVHHAGAHRVAHLEGRDRLGPADEVEPQDALALVVHPGDPGLEPLDVERVLRERAHDFQRDFLGARRRGKQQGDDEAIAESRHGPLLDVRPDSRGLRPESRGGRARCQSGRPVGLAARWLGDPPDRVLTFLPREG